MAGCFIAPCAAWNHFRESLEPRGISGPFPLADWAKPGRDPSEDGPPPLLVARSSLHHPRSNEVRQKPFGFLSSPVSSSGCPPSFAPEPTQSQKCVDNGYVADLVDLILL